MAEEKSFFISILLGLKLLQVPSVRLERVKKMKNEEERVDREHQIIYLYLFSPSPFVLSFHAMVRRSECIMLPFWKGVRGDVPSGMAGSRLGGGSWQTAGRGGSCSGRGGCRGRQGWVARARLLFI